jgi:hypothetical protein
MSHWQKVKTHNKQGQKKKEIENHFGIKGKQNIVTDLKKSKPLTKEQLVSKKSTKKKSK